MCVYIYIYDGWGYGAFSVVLHPCMHAIRKLSNDGDEFLGAAVFCHDSPKAISAEHVKCLGQINMSSWGQCSVSDTSLAASTMSTVLRSLWKLHWLSSKCPCLRWLLRWFRRTLALILPEIKSKEVLRWLSHACQFKQGCVLAPTLFSIMLSVMLFDAFHSLNNGIDIRYCTDGSVFNLRRLQAMTKVKTDIVNEFLFAADCALNATTKANMQNIVDKFSMACNNFGLTISTKKIEVMH